MNQIDHLKSFSRELNLICNKVCKSINSKQDTDPFRAISLGFVTKCDKTLKAVNLLYDNNLPEPAQILVRVLLELSLNYECFLKMSDDDIINTCHRVLDSMMLATIKQAHASNFNGVSDELRQHLKVSEQLIKDRYIDSEINKMKKYGFTGLSIEQRAHLTKKEDQYNVVFRNFSRNVHSTDYAEGFIAQGRWGDFDDYLNSRDVISLETSIFSALEINLCANIIFKCKLNLELNSFLEKYQDYKKDNSGDTSE
ncbi:MAG: hypothetical protein IH886_04590 [Nitrospinae bacterium]|nr:hypothetical protein [Nitrospinota bacterium]